MPHLKYYLSRSYLESAKCS